VAGWVVEEPAVLLADSAELVRASLSASVVAVVELDESVELESLAPPA